MLPWNSASDGDRERLEPAEVFTAGLRNHHVANTAYPIQHALTMRPYRLAGDAVHASVISAWEGVDKLGLYVHVPFCESRCSFCEYAVVDPAKSGGSAQADYVEILLRELAMYRREIGSAEKTLYGFDIGGGTPALLDERLIEKIINGAKRSFRFPSGITISIETSPAVAARMPERIASFRALGIGRISMGLQAASGKTLAAMNRGSHPFDSALSAAANIRQAGFTKFNVDLMYGFAGMTGSDWELTLQRAIALEPDFITLYRTRYKGTSIVRQALEVTLAEVNQQYRFARDVLRSNGYVAPAGKNTFSRSDGGVSDYLTGRVQDGAPYLGLGLGAQSWTARSLSYNAGAASIALDPYAAATAAGRFPIQDYYHLSIPASAAKMASVSFYFGRIEGGPFKKVYGLSPAAMFPAAVDFLVRRGCIEIAADGGIIITSEGMDCFAGVAAQFYAPSVQEYLVKTPLAISAGADEVA